MARTKPTTRSKNPIQEVLEKARATDRRRMAQINNQIGTINRLLGNGGSYDEEMKILHEGSAALAAEKDELREALRALADACALTLPGSAWSDEIVDAVDRATQLVGPMRTEAVSDVVSERQSEGG